MATILAFSGSLGKDSINQKLVVHAADLARAHGAEVELISLRDFDLPLFNTDIEAESGLPADAVRLKELMKASDGFLIACPEYNSSITPALKNAIDWASRPVEGETPLECFAGKCAALCATSPGGLGGLRGLDHVREILGNIRMHVVPGMVAVPSAFNAFNDDGTLKDEAVRGRLDSLVANLVRVADAL